MEVLFTKTPLLFFVQNLWRDEAFSYILAQKSIVDIIRLTATDFNPPLYYILLHFWMMIVGTSEIALRSLSLIFFLGTAFVLFEIMREIFKIPLKRAIIYLLFSLMNPFLITYAFEARMYMMVTFLITLAYYALWTERKKTYMVAITLALYTHYFAVFILLVQFVPPLLQLCGETIYLLRKKNMREHVITSLLRHRTKVLTYKNLQSELWYFFVPIVLFFPWALYLSIHHNFSDSKFWIIQPPVWDFLYIPFILFTGYERVFGEYYHDAAGYTRFHTNMNILLIMILLIPLLLFAVQMLQKKRHNEHKLNTKFLDILLWTFVPPVSVFILSFITQPLYLPRYVIFSSTGFLLLLILSFEYIVSLDKKKSWFFSFSALVLFFFLLNFTNWFNQLNLKYHSKRTIAPLYREIEVLRKPEDKIYLTSELDYFLAMYYFKNPAHIFIYEKTYEEIPMFVGKILIPQEVIAQMLPIFPLKAFVVYYNWFNVRSNL